MRRGFKCRENVLKSLRKGYDLIVKNECNGDYLKAVENFDSIAEKNLRSILNSFYDNHRSRDQAWKTCKGSLYEYAVFKCIQQIITKNKMDNKLLVLMGDRALLQHKDQIVIRNWSDIFPDVDIIIVEKKDQFRKSNYFV